MSGHRVEISISFFVGDPGREEAEQVVRHLEEAVFDIESMGYASGFSVSPSGVDGNGWYEKWPPRTVCQRCGGSGRVPNWQDWNDEYGEPRPKPCPDCAEE